MTDFVVLGTDTDAGKTTLALLWLAAFGDDTEYWKPVETGDPDSERLRRLVPAAVVHPPLARFTAPVAPPLAARQEGKTMPTASAVAAAKPAPATPGRHLLVETFGSPLSPFTDNELQIELIRLLDLPMILVASSEIGAIGRTLQSLHALAAHHLYPKAVALIGPLDEFAAAQIARNWTGIRVVSLSPPAVWDIAGVACAANEQREALSDVRHYLFASSLNLHSSSLLLEADRETVWHPYTSLAETDAPLQVVGAQDEFLHLADGRRVIDGISSWWTILHGHRFPPLMTALAEAMRTWDHVLFAGVTHRPAVELAALLLQSAPWQGGGRVFYSDDGSTAVEVALKMAYQFWCHRGEPGRTCFVGFENGYHGDTFGAMAVGRDPLFFGRFEPLLFRAERVPLSAARLDDLLSKRRGEVAAVIVEPLVQGAGGMRMHTPEELQALFQVTRRHNVLFIADEVMTGGGRTGTLWAAHRRGDRAGPDLCGQDPGRRHFAPGGDAGRARRGRCLRHGRPGADVLPRPFVHGPSAGVCRRRRQLAAAPDDRGPGRPAPHGGVLARGTDPAARPARRARGAHPRQHRGGGAGRTGRLPCSGRPAPAAQLSGGRRLPAAARQCAVCAAAVWHHGNVAAPNRRRNVPGRGMTTAAPRSPIWPHDVY